MANCPKCDADLYKLETYSNMYKTLNCTSCDIPLYLEYDEYQCGDDYYDLWMWETPEEHEKKVDELIKRHNSKIK